MNHPLVLPRTTSIVMVLVISGLVGIGLAPTAAAFDCPASVAPIVTGLSSSTHGAQSTWYGKSAMRFGWSGTAYNKGCASAYIDGYSWDLIESGASSPPALDCVINEPQQSPPANHMGYSTYWTGDSTPWPSWYERLPTDWWMKTFRVRAIDNWAQCGAVSTYTVYNDYDFPAIEELRPSHGATVSDPLTPIQVLHNDEDSGRDPNGDYTTIATGSTRLWVDADSYYWDSPVTLDYAATTDFKFTPTVNWEKGFHKFSFQLKDTAIGSPAPLYWDWGQFKMDCGLDPVCEAAFVVESVQNQKEDAKEDTGGGGPQHAACESDDLTPGDHTNSLIGPRSTMGDMVQRNMRHSGLSGQHNSLMQTLEPVTDALNDSYGWSDQVAYVCFQSRFTRAVWDQTQGVWDSI